MNILRGEDKDIQLKPVSEAPRFAHKLGEKVINIPGKEIITQPIVQEYYE